MPDHDDAFDSNDSAGQPPETGAGDTAPPEALAELRARVARLDRRSTDEADLDLRCELGIAEVADGSPARGVTQFELVVAALTEQLGADHPETMVVRGHLGRALTEARLFDRAEAVLRELLADRTAVLGADHAATLVTRGNLLRAIGRAGRPEEALLMAEGLLGDRERLLGAEHPETLQTRGHIAQLLELAGRRAEAVEAHRLLLDDRIRLLGVDHPDTLTSVHNLVTTRRAEGTTSLDELVALCEQLTSVLGPDHPATLGVRQGIVHELIQQCRGDEAEPALRAVAADCARVLGELDPVTIEAQLLQADLHLMRGEWEQATAGYDAVVRLRTRVFGPTAIDTLRARFRLAWSMRYHDPADRFMDEVDELTRDAEAVLEPWHPFIARVERLLMPDELDDDDDEGYWDRDEDDDEPDTD
jgi:hypothetical protein